MRLVLGIVLLLGLAACSASLSFEQERDGGIGGTGGYVGETLLE